MNERRGYRRWGGKAKVLLLCVCLSGLAGSAPADGK